MESYVSVDKFIPLKFTLVQRESKKSVDSLQLFDHDEKQAFQWLKQVKKGKEVNHNSKRFIPGFFQDGLSYIHFIRGLEFKNKKTLKFPIVTKKKIYLSTVRFAGTEKIKLGKVWYKSIKVIATNSFPGAKKKKGELTFWFSNDHEKRILKFKGSIKIGTVEGELIKYTKQ